MVITLVMDQYGKMNNGTTATARYFAERMRSKGHTVRIVTAIPNVNDEENIYVVKERYYPIVTAIIHMHGMVLGKPEISTLTEAITGSDIVHFYLQFKLAKKGKEIADSLGIASTAAFHFQAENVSYNIGLGKSKVVNDWLYKYYRDYFNSFSHIHVPSNMMKGLLKSYGYTSHIHAISNGVNPAFMPVESARPKELEGKYIITMTGRLAGEKRQCDIVEAVSKSKYKDKIQLLFCGKGPKQKKLIKQAKKLGLNAPIFKFVNREELIKTLNYCDLYVHSSIIESEAIACMEAFACGLVPVIAAAERSATKQFAINESNVYPCGNTDELAKKIDFYIENPEVKAQHSKDYLAFTQNFTLEKCTDALEQMFETAIDDNLRLLKNRQAEKEYLATLSASEVTEYNERKLAYSHQQAQNGGHPDYEEEYINSIKA